MGNQNKYNLNNQIEEIEVVKTKKTDQISGEVFISGSKNVALKVMAASLMVDKPMILKNLPGNNQVKFFFNVLPELGGEVSVSSGNQVGYNIAIMVDELSRMELFDSEIKQCRHTFLMTIPMLARKGSVIVTLPGYSHYGFRPVNSQLSALKSFGAEMSFIGEGRMQVKLPPHKFVGKEIFLKYPSNAATEAMLYLAVASRGETTIHGAALSPELNNIALFFTTMGVHFTGVGTECITVMSPGMENLNHPGEFSCFYDRIEAATFGAAVAIIGGDLKIHGADINHLAAVSATLQEMGCEVSVGDRYIEVVSNGAVSPCDIYTGPYPAFPTDVQGPFLSALSVAKGVSVLAENVWPNRLSQCMELLTMGANISVYEGHLAVIRGVEKLFGATVMGSDPRATAGLILAGLVASTPSTIIGIDLLDNAYDSFPEKLRKVGAGVERVTVEKKDVSRVNPKYGRLEAV
jgi:UDP-N-acetylglucosamine 1-carboxyvinyltransferase